MDKLVALCKGRGFVFPGSEIYGRSEANSWDYGPLGVEFKEQRQKRAWWKKFVQEGNKYNVGIDCAILMNRRFGWRSRPRQLVQRPADGLQGLQGALPRG